MFSFSAGTYNLWSRVSNILKYFLVVFYNEVPGIHCSWSVILAFYAIWQKLYNRPLKLCTFFYKNCGRLFTHKFRERVWGLIWFISSRINDFLSRVNLGERTIRGCLEAYSCQWDMLFVSSIYAINLDWRRYKWCSFLFIGKHTGSDKKLSFSLENEVELIMHDFFLF